MGTPENLPRSRSSNKSFASITRSRGAETKSIAVRKATFVPLKVGISKSSSSAIRSTSTCAGMPWSLDGWYCQDIASNCRKADFLAKDGACSRIRKISGFPSSSAVAMLAIGSWEHREHIAHLRDGLPVVKAIRKNTKGKCLDPRVKTNYPMRERIKPYAERWSSD